MIRRRSRAPNGREDKSQSAPATAAGQCLCGRVAFEIDVPARWAWHDHSAASRRAHGAAYATYVGSWRKRFRITKGKAAITRFEDKATKTVRSFCARCGTPLFYERAALAAMVNIPRALFSGRTGRQPLYHIAIEEMQEWTYTGEPLVPLKGFPGVVWHRSKKKKRIDHEGDVLTSVLRSQGSHDRRSIDLALGDRPCCSNPAWSTATGSGRTS